MSIYCCIPFASGTLLFLIPLTVQVWFRAPVWTTPSLDSVLTAMSSIVTRTDDRKLNSSTILLPIVKLVKSLILFYE